MSQYHRGRRKEWVVRDVLRRHRYDVVRSAQSEGLIDLVAVRGRWIRLIQVKYSRNAHRLSSWYDANVQTLQRRQFAPNVSKEVWVFQFGVKRPTVYYL